MIFVHTFPGQKLVPNPEMLLKKGCKCMVHIKENVKCIGYVQEIFDDTAQVFLEPIGERCVSYLFLKIYDSSS